MTHIPVLLAETLDLLAPQSGERVLDVTLGLGGHAEAMLAAIGSRGHVIGIDADADNLAVARGRLGEDAVTYIHSNFGALMTLNLDPVDIVFADLGLSSPHIDHPEKGFSFRNQGPLDCRFDRSTGKTAADLLMSSSEQELIRLFTTYGEVERVRPLVAAILSYRKTDVIHTTQDLVSIAHSVYSWKAPKILPQIFQALRIVVNDELHALEALLASLPALVRPGGRVGIISYHSLEDRLVKQVFRDLTTAPKHPVTGGDLSPAPFSLLTRKPVRPSDQECDANPRSRSARLRAILRA